jgi:hypothetical protein
VIIELFTKQFTVSPDRWKNIPKEAEKMPGVWGNQVSFLTGPKGCIGFRFAVLEYVYSS